MQQPEAVGKEDRPRPRKPPSIREKGVTSAPGSRPGSDLLASLVFRDVRRSKTRLIHICITDFNLQNTLSFSYLIYSTTMRRKNSSIDGKEFPRGRVIWLRVPKSEDKLALCSEAETCVQKKPAEG